ncbi:MAG: Ig-like domain repeat protein [Trebonia sp.]
MQATDNSGNCYDPPVGTVYTLVKSTGGAVTGTFGNAPVTGDDVTPHCGSGTAPTFQIAYTANSVTATVVTAGSSSVTSTTGLASVPSSPTTNQPVTLTATVTSSSVSVTPAGTVQFDDGNGNPISGCTSQPLTETGPGTSTATCTTSFAAAGSPHSLTATFISTNSGLTGSTSAPEMLTVGPASTTTALQASTTSPQTGQSVTYTATVTPAQAGSSSPSGTVEFLDGGSPISGCGAQPISGGTATCTVSYTAAGTHAITAQYGGDANFDGSTSPATTVTAAAPSTTIPSTTTPSTTTPSATGPGTGRTGSARVVRTGLADRLSCAGASTQTCTFGLKLTVVETWRGRRLTGVAARAGLTKVRKRTVTLGSKTVRLSGGASVTVKLSLNAAGRALLKKRGILHVALTVKQGSRTVRRQTVTFREPKKK